MTVYYRREFAGTARLYRSVACLVQFVDTGRAGDFAGSQGDQRRDELDGSVRFTGVGSTVLVSDRPSIGLIVEDQCDSTSDSIQQISRYSSILFFCKCLSSYLLTIIVSFTGIAGIVFTQ